MIKYYLLFLLLVIMGAGARTMFEVAYQGFAFEHDAVPSKPVAFLMGVVGWFALMMIADVWVLMHPELNKDRRVIVLLSIGILAPTVYMLVHH